MRPLVLDLFCGPGGAAQGWIAAGFDVVGIDINPQPDYPGPFYQLDVTRFCVVGDVIYTDAPELGGMPSSLPLLSRFVLASASPPCQFATALARARSNVREDHQNLIPFTRWLLKSMGLPYVIENVGGARSHLIDPVMLCGAHFFSPPAQGFDTSLPDFINSPWPTPTGYESPEEFAEICRRDIGRYNRPRYFETKKLTLTEPEKHRTQWPTGCNGATNRKAGSRRTVAIGQYNGGISSLPGQRPKGWTKVSLAYQRAVIGMSGECSLTSLSQAVPPAYTEYIGRSFLAQVKP